ncbi:MAG: glycosyl hydrolase [Planctomycetota bacterium]
MLLGAALGAQMGTVAVKYVRGYSIRLLFAVTIFIACISVLLKQIKAQTASSVMILTAGMAIAVLIADWGWSGAPALTQDSLPVAAGNELAQSFVNPPHSAKPHTWWHWLNGNITAEGITADLEAMKRAGVGGAQIFNVDCDIPAGDAPFLSDRWRRLVRHAVAEADRLGLELCIHNCAGWSSSGGPWVKPEHAMLVVTTSERTVRGPAQFDEDLPQPATKLDFYRDIAVLAFPTPGGSSELDTLRIENLEGKAAFTRADNLTPAHGVPTTERLAVAPDQIADLTGFTRFVASNVHLTWDVPEGSWTILRLGYTPTGKTNHPAPTAGRGLECDKMSREAMDAFFAGMMRAVIADAGALVGKSLNNALIDSYEVGSQNWTPTFRYEFITRRGYDPLPRLVTLSGRVVENVETSERFLWDFRRTIAGLFRDNYFAYFAELCRRHGMLTSVEPYGNGPFDDLEAGGTGDIPMGEFWIGTEGHESLRLAASVAHTHGRKIVGAESFTADSSAGRWQNDPFSLKALGDRVFCLGINRYIFHRYAHQPWLDLRPGMTMGPWGFHFERTNTWWEQGAAWLRYVARCQFLLQQGLFVADVIVYVGEDSPVGFRVGNPPIPRGYDYDACSRDVLLNRLAVRDGRLVLPDGMSYRLLVLPPVDSMTPAVVARIEELVTSGATVVGPKPTRSPSLSGYPACDAEVRRIADKVWGDGDGVTITEHTYGKGRVFWGQPLERILTELEVPPDFEHAPSGDVEVLAIHRVAGETDIYFVSNQSRRSESIEATFRVGGREPELWWPDTGKIELAPLFSAERGRTTVPLVLDPAGSVFVVFRKPLGTQDHFASLTHDGRPVLDLRAGGAGTQRLVIDKAIYGVLADSVRCVDVTEVLAAKVRSGTLAASATNELGGDPAYGVVKELQVDYTLDGKKDSVTVKEGALLLIPQAAMTQRAVAEPALNASRELQLIAWQGGLYEAKTAAGRTVRAEVSEPARPLELPGPWEVSFPPDLGAPPRITLPRLMSWTQHDDDRVRHFSGTATYTTLAEVPPSLLGAGRRLQLDLGQVKNLAEVRVNDIDCGILWKPPFAVDVTEALSRGPNRIQIKVTNLWVNRLIGDDRLPRDVEWASGGPLAAWPEWLVEKRPRPETGRLTFTTWHHWSTNDPLPDSGLLGPVTLRQGVVATLRP